LRTPTSNTPAHQPGLAQGRVLLVIVDPDAAAAEALASQLSDHHVDADVHHRPTDALLQVGALQPDAVLVAAELPVISSAEIVRVLSTRLGIPVFVGVGAADGAAAAQALATGAIACVARPYRVQEIVPLLRSIRPEAVGSLDPPIERGALRLDPGTLEVRLHGRPIRLPHKEFQLLRLFMTNADRVVTHEQIRAAVWSDAAPTGSNTLSVHIRRLRSRLGDPPDTPKIIITVRGLGYRLVPPSASR
jgi:DNA-binding response OmpR family regulator